MSEKELVLRNYGSLTAGVVTRGGFTYITLAGPRGSKILQEPHEALALADKIWPGPKAPPGSNLAIFGVGLVPPTAAQDFAGVLREWARSATERRAEFGVPVPWHAAMPETPRTGIEDAWLVWSDKATGWWRAGGNGYTTSILEAGIFTQADAMDKEATRPEDFAHKLTDAMKSREGPEGTVAELLGVLGLEELLFNGGSR